MEASNTNPYSKIEEPYSHTEHSINVVPKEKKGESEVVNYLSNKASYLGSKVKQVGKNALTAKLNPFSDPPGWADKMNRATEDKSRRKALINVRTKELMGVSDQIQTLEKQFEGKEPPKELTYLYAVRDLMQEQLNALSEKFDDSKKHVQYLKDIRSAQVQSRFAGYAGMATNIVIPGAGPVVSTTITAALTVVQERSAQSLPEDENANRERYNTHFNTCLTTALTAASLGFSVLVMPIIKDHLGM